MKRFKKAYRVVLCLLLAAIFMAGCSLADGSETKERDLEFVVLAEERIPEELRNILTEKKTAPFQITFADGDNLYLCVGYGRQESGGYSIAVDDLFLTESSVHLDTVLLGPDPSDKPKAVPSYPYIVLRTEYLDMPVIFE